MKALFIAVTVVSIASSVLAGINTPKPMGPLKFVIDQAGNGVITNAGSTPFSFDGYTISSAGANIVGDPTGIFDNTLADMAFFAPTLGLTMAQALAWSEMAKTAMNYSEVTLDMFATLQPGGTLALGPHFPDGNQADLTFTYVYSSSTTGVTSWEGYVIPEPTSLTLFTLGVLAAIRRKR